MMGESVSMLFDFVGRTLIAPEGVTLNCSIQSSGAEREFSFEKGARFELVDVYEDHLTMSHRAVIFIFDAKRCRTVKANSLEKSLIDGLVKVWKPKPKKAQKQPITVEAKRSFKPFGYYTSENAAFADQEGHLRIKVGDLIKVLDYDPDEDTVKLTIGDHTAEFYFAMSGDGLAGAIGASQFDQVLLAMLHDEEKPEGDSNVQTNDERKGAWA